jgi:hypothetical protein
VRLSSPGSAATSPQPETRCFVTDSPRFKRPEHDVVFVGSPAGALPPLVGRVPSTGPPPTCYAPRLLRPFPAVRPNPKIGANSRAHVTRTHGMGDATCPSNEQFFLLPLPRCHKTHPTPEAFRGLLWRCPFAGWISKCRARGRASENVRFLRDTISCAFELEPRKPTPRGIGQRGGGKARETIDQGITQWEDTIMRTRLNLLSHLGPDFLAFCWAGSHWSHTPGVAHKKYRNHRYGERVRVPGAAAACTVFRRSPRSNQPRAAIL